MKANCPKCGPIGRIWNKDVKTDEEVEHLRLIVPEIYERVNEYYDEDGQKWYVMQCRSCSTIIQVPA
ncbi:unnamed protein product [marine sediment metagenome]|uniref:Uncharacterized protein n=1 Tax=marine sediment metagenome TaxID=412755 RepID=X1UKB5_9ZZZZ